MIFIFLPTIIIYGSYYICKQYGYSFKNSESNSMISFIWTILNILTGISWNLSREKYFYYLMFLLSSWLFMYLVIKNIFFSLIILLSSTIITYIIMKRLIKKKQKTAKRLLIPLLLWLFYACYLNFKEI